MFGVYPPIDVVLYVLKPFRVQYNIPSEENYLFHNFSFN